MEVQERVISLEAALLEYVERYGLTEMARKLLTEPPLSRTSSGQSVGGIGPQPLKKQEV